MKKSKIINLLSIMILSSTLMHANNQHQQKHHHRKNTTPEGFIFSCSDEIMNDETKWPQENTKEYIYDKHESFEPANGITIEPSIDIKCGEHTFSTAITRIKTTAEQHGEKIKTTVETWTTRHPSYLKPTTAVLGAAAALGIAGAAYDITYGTKHFNPYVPYVGFKQLDL